MTGDLQRILVSLAKQVDAREIASQLGEQGGTPANPFSYHPGAAGSDHHRGSFGLSAEPHLVDGVAEVSVGAALTALEASSSV